MKVYAESLVSILGPAVPIDAASAVGLAVLKHIRANQGSERKSSKPKGQRGGEE